VNNASLFYSIFVRIALPIVTMLVMPTAQATVFNVDTTDDLPDDGLAVTACHTRYGNCSLRAAIMKANQFRGSSTIYIPAGTYALTIPPSLVDGDGDGDLNISATGLLRQPGTIALVGAGADSTIIDANQIDRVLTVSVKARATITGVTLRGGQPHVLKQYGRWGGGIRNLGALTVTDSVIESNLASWGGGIDNEGALTITDSMVSNNRAEEVGGGIFSFVTLNVVRSTVRSNVADYGGGIDIQGAATIRNSTISNNEARHGGGVLTTRSRFSEPCPCLQVINSTISYNTASADGGGINSEGATTLYNTTVVGNDADHDRDETYGGNGGGVYVYAWAGYPNYYYLSRFIAVNSLIADNTQRDTPISDDCFGTLEVYGWNLFGDVSGCAFTGNGYSAVGLLSPNSLGPLQDDGGPTQTHALLPGSNAIDAAYAQGCVDETGAVLMTDQRGVPRGIGSYCDIGAFESNDQ
jgi:hypothetical protein